MFDATNSGDYLYSIIKTTPNVQVLNFKNNILSLKDCKAIGKVLSDHKNIKELDLTNTCLN